MTSQISSLKTYKFTAGASKLQPARRPPISVQHYIISQSEHGINVGSRELSCRIHCASDFLLLLSPAVLSAEKIAKFIWTFSTVQIESPAEYWPCLHFKATAVVVHGLLCDISSSKFPSFVVKTQKKWHKLYTDCICLGNPFIWWINLFSRTTFKWGGL